MSNAIGRACESVSQWDGRLRYSTLEVSIKLWRAEAAVQSERNRTLLDFNFIKKKKIREDEKNEQDDGQQGKHL